ncbi:MAG TPA: M56 family metallopeptidase [Candidatus Cybelea sp.]|nr:M56 family metallopeptidase [Candidatus Cybelea sp.]
MNHFAGWISPDIMRTLGWALVHFLWQGLALAALASMALALCRSAAVRYLVGIATLLLMLAAPLLTLELLWPDRSDRLAAASRASLSTLPATASGAALPSTPDLTDSASSAKPPVFPRNDLLLWIVEGWFAGVIILSLRTAGGVFVLECMRRREAAPVSASVRQLCLAVQRRLGIRRAVRYCHSHMLDAPAVIGWIRPAVLLPLTALTGLSDEQLEAIIAHELAHIRRLDNFVNLFQIVAETLLFYHPAVWWLSKRIRLERENCCDDAALSVCRDAAKYARALALMAESRTAPSLAMAANRGPLAARVARLLGTASPRSRARSAGIAASCVLLAGALLAANGFFGIAHTALGSGLPARFTTSWSGSTTPHSAPLQLEPASAARASVQSQVASLARSLVRATVHSMVAEATSTPTTRVAYSWQEPSQKGESETSKGSYIEGMKAAGLDNLTPDELLALKIQGVTPEYVRAIHDLGFKLSADGLIGMKVQGITPDYIREMRAAGVNPDADTLIGMKVQGITPDYVRAMHALGISVDADDLIGLKVQGVTPDYIKQMRAAGVEVKSDSVIGMKVQGITPEYVQQMHDLGIPPNADELIGMKVQGVTSEYIKGMRALGLDVAADQAIALRVQGVTPEYVKGMRDLGLKASTDQLIGMRVQGVTSEYVKSLRATGLHAFKDDPDAYIAARVQGITPEFVAEAQKHGFKDLDLDKLIELKAAGIF